MDYGFFTQAEEEEKLPGFEDEPTFVDEMGAWERAGPSGNLQQTLIQGGNIAELQKRTSKAIEDPVHRFEIYIDAISRKLEADGVYEISQTDINNMIAVTSNIPNIQYKNATAFILGYLASNGGKELEKDRVNEIFEGIENRIVKEAGVYEADVIRYARLWQTLRR